MSGGHFDYQQYRIADIADSVERLIANNNSTEEYAHNFPPEIIQHFEDALVHLNKASVYIQRIDWLVSGDDGEDSFLQRLQSELDELK